MERECLIKVNGLSKAFEINNVSQNVLKNINVEIYKNDFTIIMGPSGAGK